MRTDDQSTVSVRIVGSKADVTQAYDRPSKLEARTEPWLLHGLIPYFRGWSSRAVGLSRSRCSFNQDVAPALVQMLHDQEVMPVPQCNQPRTRHIIVDRYHL